MTTTDTDAAHDAPPDADAGQPGEQQQAEERTHPEDGFDDRGGALPEGDDDDQDDGNRSNREKRYRLRLREAERQIAERDELIARMRQADVNAAVNRAGYTEKVAQLIASDMDALLDDHGVLDPAKVSNAIISVTAEYGITRKARPPQPNYQQGRASGHPGGKSSWGSAIKGESAGN